MRELERVQVRGLAPALALGFVMQPEVWVPERELQLESVRE